MVIRLYSGGLEGVDAFPVEVEVDYVRQGLPSFSLVGLAETEVREARDRVFAALRACNFRLPPARITVNLAPAGQRKAGTGYDLPLAVGLLAAAGLIPADRLPGLFFTGELSLTGSLKPVRGVLPLAILARRHEAAGLVTPPGNAAEAAVVPGLPVYAPRDLSGRGRGAGSPTAWRKCRAVVCPVGLRGGQRPAGRQTRLGNSRRRRAQPLADRAAGQWKNHAGPAPARHSAAAFL